VLKVHVMNSSFTIVITVLQHNNNIQYALRKCNLKCAVKNVLFSFTKLTEKIDVAA